MGIAIDTGAIPGTRVTERGLREKALWLPLWISL